MTTSKVTPLFDGEADMSERLATLAERAKTGEFASVAVIVTYDDGGAGTMYKLGSTGNVFATLGAIEVVKNRIIEECIE